MFIVKFVILQCLECFIRTIDSLNNYSPCLSLKKVDSQNQKTNANQTFTQTGALL